MKAACGLPCLGVSDPLQPAFGRQVVVPELDAPEGSVRGAGFQLSVLGTWRQTEEKGCGTSIGWAPGRQHLS